MQPKTSIPRIHSVHMKNGGADVRVLRHYPNNDRQQVEIRIKRVLDDSFRDGRSAGGFAFCIWDREGASISELINFCGPVPTAMIPDFAHNLLVQRVAEKWITGQ